MTKRNGQASDGPVRPRPTGSRCRAIVIAVVAAPVGLGALAGLQRPVPHPSRYTVAEEPTVAGSAPIDPLRAELMRCRALPANADDARCREAWEVNRRRFLGESRSLVRRPSASAASSGEPWFASLPGNGER